MFVSTSPKLKRRYINKVNHDVLKYKEVFDNMTVVLNNPQNDTVIRKKSLQKNLCIVDNSVLVSCSCCRSLTWHWAAVIWYLSILQSRWMKRSMVKRGHHNPIEYNICDVIQWWVYQRTI